MRQMLVRIDKIILIESSCTYSLDGFARLAVSAGFDVEQVWRDEARLFRMQALVAR